MGNLRKKTPPAPFNASAHAVRWRVIIIASAVILTYSNGLSGPFVLDDQSSVVQNVEIRDLSHLDRVLQPAQDSSESGRPLVNLSFAINYAIGGLDVRGYHVWNVAMHIACALLVFGIVRRTLELPGTRDRLAKVSPTLAFTVALVWAVHPLNSEVVDYVTQRTESMMAAFLLLTLYASIRGRMPSDGRWRIIAVASCALGMACKESMVTAPVLVAVYDRVYLYGSWGDAFRTRGRFYLALAASWIVLAGLVLSGPRAAVIGFSSGVSVWTYLLNQTVMITKYLHLAIWPTPLVVFYGWPLPLSLGDVIWHAMFIVALLILTLMMLLRAPRWGYLGAWFFITLAPTSSVIAIATEVGAERRMYLPLISLAALASVGGYMLAVRLAAQGAGADRPSRWRHAAVSTAMIAVVCALAVTTFIRNREYSSGLTLARTVVERRPTSVAHHIFGEQLALAGRAQEAVAELGQAVAGGNSRARFQLGTMLAGQGKGDEALEQLGAFVQTEGMQLFPRWLVPPVVDVLNARVLMAEVFLEQQRWPEAEAQAELVLAKAPGHAGARRVVASAMFAQQRWPEAVREYRDYLHARPTDAQGLINFGIALVATGNMDEAVTAFRRAVEVEPSANAKRLLEMALRDRAAAAASRR